MKVTSKSLTGFELTLEFPKEMKLKDGSPFKGEQAAEELLNIAYKPMLDKLVCFLSYTIGSQDVNAMQILEATMSNIANSKLKNM